MKKQTKAKKTISKILLVALIVGLFFGYKAFDKRRNIPDVMLINPATSSFNRGLNLNATVQAETSQTVKSNLGLEVEKFLVDEGDQVKKGQSLVLYSKKSAKGQLDKAKQKLEDLEKKKEKQEEEMNALLNNLASSMMSGFNLDMGSAASILKSNLGNIDLSKEIEKLVPKIDIKKELESVADNSQTLKDLETIIGTTAGFVQNLQNTVYTLKNLGVGNIDSNTIYNYYKNALELKRQLDNILNNLDNTLENNSAISDTVLTEIMRLKSIVAKEQEKIKEIIKTLEEIIKEIQDLPSPTLPSLPIPTLPSFPIPTIAPTTVSSPTDDTTPSSTTLEDVVPSMSEEVTTPTEQTETFEVVLPDPTDNSTDNTLSDSSSNNETTTEQESKGHIGGGSDITPEMLFVLMQMEQAEDKDNMETLEERIAKLEKMIKKNDFTVFSEIDGIVVKTSKEDNKDIEYDMLVLDNTSLIAEVYVGKSDAERIQVGQKVNYPNDNLDIKGEVIYKSVIAEKKGSPDILDSLGSIPLSSDLVGGDPKVLVKLSIDGDDATRLVIGFDINAEIEIENVTNVLAIPTDSIILDRDKYFVYYADDEQILSQKEIEVGLIGETLVEVKSGLDRNSWLVENPNASGLVLGEKINIVIE